MGDDVGKALACIFAPHIPGVNPCMPLPQPTLPAHPTLPHPVLPQPRFPVFAPNARYVPPPPRQQCWARNILRFDRGQDQSIERMVPMRLTQETQFILRGDRSSSTEIYVQMKKDWMNGNSVAIYAKESTSRSWSSVGQLQLASGNPFQNGFAVQSGDFDRDGREDFQLIVKQDVFDYAVFTYFNRSEIQMVCQPW